MRKKVPGKPTLADVARRAGVSAATVSRCLTRPLLVREDVRKRVAKIIEDIGYSPHAAARSLALSRSSTVGVIVPSLDITSFATGVGALQARLSAAGYMLQLAISGYTASQELACVRELIARGVDGLVMVGTRHSPDVFALLEGHAVPFVNIWDFGDDHRPCIGFDNREAGRRIAEYVLDAGHSKIAVIAGGGPQRSDRSVARLEGALEAIRLRGIEMPPNMIVEVPYVMQAGSAAVQSLLESANPPSAVICTNDVLAVGAMLECIRRGKRVPEDISFTGFDGLEIASLVSPRLTTIRIPASEMGLLSADYLIDKLNGREPLARVKLDFSLIVGESVCRMSPTGRRTRARAARD